MQGHRHWTNAEAADLTKVWSHADYPLIEVGVIELNRNPANNFAEIEQALLALEHRSGHRFLAGQGAAGADLLLRRRAQSPPRHAHEALPVNAPQCSVHTYHKDGQMRFFPNNPNPDAYYEPNLFNGPVERPDLAEPP